MNMIPELEEISSPFAKEEWIVKKMNQIVSATIAGNLFLNANQSKIPNFCWGGVR
jgi:hypothetical protein